MKVSVLVSTYNRCDKLRLFLEAMKTSGSARLAETEVLVIDNNSNDATKQVVAEYASLLSPVVRYLWEGEPGKSRALNLAIREARGEIIAFTDDDCIPSPTWVDSIFEEFESDPELCVLGGRVELYDPNDARQAVSLSSCRMLVRNAREVFKPAAIIGANMAFRKSVLQIAGGFDPVLGPGSVCKADEDLDLIYRCLKRKFKIVYSPEVVVFHNHGRRTELDENKTSFAYAFGRGALYVKYVLRLDPEVAGIAFRELLDLAETLMIGAIRRTKFPYHQLALRAIFLGAFSYFRARFLWKRIPRTILRERTDAC